MSLNKKQGGSIKHYKFDYPKKIGFDFDGCLSSNKLCQVYAQFLTDVGTPVVIVTKRTPEEREEVLMAADKYGIPRSQVFFTSGQIKSPIINNLHLSKFFDDSPDNVADINKNTDTKAVLIINK